MIRISNWEDVKGRGPYRFKTSYGLIYVVGGNFDFFRTPTSYEELNAPFIEISPQLLEEVERRHKQSVENFFADWGL